MVHSIKRATVVGMTISTVICQPRFVQKPIELGV